MKKNRHLIIVPACIIFSLFYGCSKESDSSPTTLPSATVSNMSSTSGDTTTLVLQPGPDGDDAYVFTEQGVPEAAAGNDNAIPELMLAAWTAQGNPLKGRVYIKFRGLNDVPATAHIVSAELDLYGMDPNTSLSTPQGCSVYPGSPYNQYKDNSCAVLRVMSSDWSEETITWNNKPDYGGNTAGFIPSSTSQWNYNATSDVTKLVKQMVVHQKNYGFCIRLRYEEVYRSMLFASSESPDPAKRPKLVVKYTL